MNSLHVEFIPLEAGSVTVVTSVTRDKGDRMTLRRGRSFVMHRAACYIRMRQGSEVFKVGRSLIMIICWD